MDKIVLPILVVSFFVSLVFVSCAIWGGDITLHPLAFHA